MNLTGYNGERAQWLSLYLEEDEALWSTTEEEGQNERSPALEAGARLIYRPLYNGKKPRAAVTTSLAHAEDPRGSAHTPWSPPDCLRCDPPYRVGKLCSHADRSSRSRTQGMGRGKHLPVIAVT